MNVSYSPTQRSAWLKSFLELSAPIGGELQKIGSQTARPAALSLFLSFR